MTCRSCQLLDVRCAAVLPSTTTSTTAGGSGTTSTTLPDACAGLTGVVAARCIIDAFLAEGVCLDASSVAKVEARLRRKLSGVRTTPERALDPSAKKGERLERRAIKKLAAVGRRARALAGRKLSDACAARVNGLVSEATQRIKAS